MAVFKEEAVSASQQFTVKTLINNINNPGSMVDDHWHDYYEVLYIMDGTAKQSIEGRCASVPQGDIVLIQPGEVHSTIAVSESGCGIIVLLFFPSCLNFNNYDNMYSRYLNLFISRAKNSSGYLRYPYPFEHTILRLMSKISEEYTLRTEGYELITKGLIYEFLGYLQRIGGLAISPASMQGRYLQVVKCCRFIEEHYHQGDMTLDTVARMAGYTKEYFSRLFKEAVGENYKTFVDYVRVSEAERLLMQGGLTVGEVAERVGYTNVYSFSRVFKRVKGYPPSERIPT